MALLVFTDFLCWSPIAFFSLTAAFGLQLVSLEQAKVSTAPNSPGRARRLIAVNHWRWPLAMAARIFIHKIQGVHIPLAAAES